MSIVRTTNLYSNSTGFNTPVVFRTSGGVQNGTLCKAWVNFKGSGTVSVRASFNVGSITDFGTGDYRINFSNAVTASYFVKTTPSYQNQNNTSSVVDLNAYGTTNFRMSTFIATIGNRDPEIVTAVVFR